MMFDFVHILMVAYAIMGVVAIAGYVPQMLAFKRNPRLCQEAPMATWILWSVQTMVYFLYALVVNGDILFILACGFGMVATMLCLGFQLYGRFYASTHG